MKIRIKTAHGYLSFQPDGRVEYRDKAGSWEEIDLDGLVIDVVAPGQPDPPGEPPRVPVPDMSRSYVAAVKAQLEAQGVNLVGPCGAFAIVKRVAWGLRGAGVGLLSKPGGNNCDGYATDVIVLANRVDIVDLLGDAGGQNTPGWLVRQNEVDADRWRAPVAP